MPKDLSAIISGIQYTAPKGEAHSDPKPSANHPLVVDNSGSILSWMDLTASVFAYCQLNQCPERAPLMIERAQGIADKVIQNLGLKDSNGSDISLSSRYSLVRAILKVPMLSDIETNGMSEDEVVSMFANSMRYALDFAKEGQREGAWMGSTDAKSMEINRAALLLDRLASFEMIYSGLKDKVKHLEEGVAEGYRSRGIKNNEPHEVTEKTIQSVMGTMRRRQVEEIGLFLNEKFIDTMTTSSMILSKVMTDKIMDTVDNDMLAQEAEMVFQSCLKSVTSMLLSASRDVRVFDVIEHLKTERGRMDFKKGHGLFVPIIFDRIQPAIDLFTSSLSMESIDVRDVIDSHAIVNAGVSKDMEA